MSKIVFVWDGVPVKAPKEAALVFDSEVKREKPHILMNGVELKHCAHCNTWRRLSKFSASRATWDGLQSFCNFCHLEIDRERHGFVFKAVQVQRQG
jgi:hypothetical protein